jgi:hypothetical protein
MGMSVVNDFAGIGILTTTPSSSAAAARMVLNVEPGS